MKKKWKSKMSRCLAFSRPAERTAHYLDRLLGVSMALATPLGLLCSTPSAVLCSDYDAMETEIYNRHSNGFYIIFKRNPRTSRRVFTVYFMLLAIFTF